MHFAQPEREREREDYLKSLRIFNLRCNHFINFHIFLFYFMRGLTLYSTLVKTLKFICGNMGTIFRILTKKITTFFILPLMYAFHTLFSIMLFKNIYIINNDINISKLYLTCDDVVKCTNDLLHVSENGRDSVYREYLNTMTYEKTYNKVIYIYIERERVRERKTKSERELAYI